MKKMIFAVLAALVLTGATASAASVQKDPVPPRAEGSMGLWAG